MKLEDNNWCFACGKNNPYGLHLEFSLNEEGIIQGEFLPQEYHQGFKDIVHGGLIALILDEAMVNLLWKSGEKAVSVEFSVRLKKAVSPCKKLFFKAGIGRKEKRIIYTWAEARDEQGSIVALAKGKCMEVRDG